MVIDIDALSDLTIVDTGPHHISLAWTGPANVNRVARYRLRYNQAGSSYQDWSTPPAPGDTTATVSGLWADTEYNFTLTAFGENDEQIGEISGTGTTAPVIVNVGCHQDHMTVTFPRETLTGVDVDNMHLLDDSCRATVTNESVTFTTGLQDCGTIEDSSEAGILTFSNAAIGAPVMGANGAVRGTPFTETFQCEFTSQFVVSQGEEILYNIPSPRVQVVDGNNRFTFGMDTFTSPDFTETYKPDDYPLKVSSSDNFNFGLSVDSPLDNLELFALDCLATPSTDPDDTPSVSIIEDGCDVDPTLELDTVQSNDMALYYSIQSFTFPNIQPPNLVYIHCTMVVCFKDDPNSRCSEGCSASRRRRAVSDMAESRVRRASDRDHSAQVTQGPFEVEGGQKQASTTPTVGIAVGTVAGIAGVLLLLVVAVFVVRKRRGRGINKNAEDRVGLDNYSFEIWGKGKTGP
ncbi:PREDICTED: ZP domain-containing protein-like [Branchiostoma belcheri]|uniref:ZP domain-containing protein-like n=1 Tax=Branchiostoma belcheri TaxID=7741 RepID=A0A6P4ZFZ2_BRABE|nr:PREDICTED: ZP domain-containing protein-like [Branchiostoma belcheri]